MADRQVKVDILADEKGFTKGVKQAELATDKLHGALDRFGPIGSGIATILGKLGFSSVAGAAGLGVATAAVAAGYEIGEKAINMYVSLGEKIRTYAQVTGESADQASRQVQAFEELGVGADVAAAGMFKLAKAANTHEAALNKLGITVVRNKDGTVDLNATLLSTIDAYQATGDAAKRDAIILATFGKSGSALIPILEANAAQLKRLQDQIGMVYTQKDLNAVRDYTIAQREAKKSADEWGLTLGQALLPAQKAVYDSLNENVYVSRNMDAELVKLTGSTNGTAAAMREADRALRAQWQQAQIASIQADDLAAAQLRAADAAKAEADAEDTLYNALHKSLDANFAYQQSLLDLKKAQKDAKDLKYLDAEANLRLRESYVHVADAAVTLAEDQAAANNVTLSASQKSEIWISTLKNLEKGLAPGSPLRKALDAYIKQLDKIPHDINTNISTTHKNSTQSTSSTGTKSFDSGGIVPGPPGSAQPAIVHGGEMVLTPDQQEVLGSGAGARGGETHVHLHVGTLIAPPGGMDWLANELLRRARYAPGN
jgi:hypothetical protein